MDEEITVGQYGRKWGLIFGLISAIVFIITAAGRIDIGFAGIAIAWAVVIGMFVLGIKEFRDDNGGFVSFGEGFRLAFIIAIIGGIVRAAIQYVYLMIDTEFFAWQQEIQEARSPFGPPPEGTEMPSWVGFFQTAEFNALASIIGAIFAGLIFGAIVSAVMKNEAEEF
jgi:hypothetical protein